MALRWPAEWEPHEAIWLAWPHNAEDWPGRFGPIPWVFADFISKLSRFDRVNLIVNEATRPQAGSFLERLGTDTQRISLWDYSTDRVWTRDYCPIWIEEDGNQRAVKWRFNAWAKYDNWALDDAAGQAIAGTDAIYPLQNDLRVVLEGGGIEGNGAGTLLTTEECFLSDLQCRNPGLNRQDYESLFQRYLGISKTIWLKRGITGDDTHGHIDDLARFVSADTVVCVHEPDRSDANHDATQENVEILRAAQNAEGIPLQVITLPMPAPIVFDGQRLPASYANFFIAGKAVFVPTFNDPMDRQALRILSYCLPRHEIIGIHSGDLIWGLGTLHCMTMQQPALK
jgi:agmatine deiminase